MIAVGRPFGHTNTVGIGLKDICRPIRADRPTAAYPPNGIGGVSWWSRVGVRSAVQYRSSVDAGRIRWWGRFNPVVRA
ncbi:hypothetical protein D8S78_19685 [Natrialba swarupiae]|nr:hypothetical protein [Natrialba swarupiae]